MGVLHEIVHALWHQDFAALANPDVVWVVYAVMFLTLFLENGLLPASFLPGDSLLLLAGAMIAKGVMDFVPTMVILTTWPVLHWLVGSPTFAHLVEAELWLSFLYASYHGAMVVYLAEIMPAEVRATGFSLAYSLATALFGGFTPAISSYLIHATGDKAMPGVWLSFAAVCGLIGTLLIGRMVKQYQARHGGTPVGASL